MVVHEVRQPPVKEVVATGSADSVEEEHSYVLANPPSPAMEISVNDEEVSVQGNMSGVETQFSQPKKAKLSESLKLSDQVSNVSPVLHHKIPLRSRDDDEESEDSEKKETNLFGLNFLMWFEVGIEGKDHEE